MNRLSLSLLALVLIILFSSCAKAPMVKEPLVFYPSPPGPPRIQFLKSFTGSDDLEPPKSAFAAFATGGRDRILILDKPFGIAGYQGKIYVCDTNATVMVFDLEKNKFARMKGAQGPGKLIQPHNMSIDKDGNKYVADPVRGQVVMFDKDDSYVKAFGPVQDWKPVDAAPFEDALYVVDAKKAEIKVFDIQSGALKNSIGKNRDAASSLGLPTNIALDKEGYIYVSDPGRFQIVKLDRDGNVIGVIGALGKIPGSFARPRGIAVDRQNRLYVVDASFCNVQIFDAGTKQLLLYFGQPGQGPGDLILPAQVAIDYDNIKYFQQYADPNFHIEFLILVTNQFGPRRVNVYGFGTQQGQPYKTNEQLLEELKERIEKEQKDKQEHPGKEAGAEQKKDDAAPQ